MWIHHVATISKQLSIWWTCYPMLELPGRQWTNTIICMMTFTRVWWIFDSIWVKKHNSQVNKARKMSSLLLTLLELENILMKFSKSEDDTEIQHKVLHRFKICYLISLEVKLMLRPFRRHVRAPDAECANNSEKRRLSPFYPAANPVQSNF